MEGIKRKNAKIITGAPARREGNVSSVTVLFPISPKYLKYNICRKFAFLFLTGNAIEESTVFILITLGAIPAEIIILGKNVKMAQVASTPMSKWNPMPRMTI